MDEKYRDYGELLYIDSEKHIYRKRFLNLLQIISLILISILIIFMVINEELVVKLLFSVVVLASIWVIIGQISFLLGQFKIYEKGIRPTSLLFRFIPFSDIVEIEEGGSQPNNYPVLRIKKRRSIRKYKIASRRMRHVDELPEDYQKVRKIIFENTNRKG